MRSFLAALGLMLLHFASMAQAPNRSTIHFRLSDGQAMLLTINSRDYKKVNTRLTVGDLPGKRQYIQVYRFRPYKDGNGGKAELVYSGRIKVQPGNTYDAIVDVRAHKLMLKNLGNNPSNVPASPYMPPPPASAPDANSNVILEDQTMNTPAPLLRLKQQMDAEKIDSKKVNIAKQYVASKGVNCSNLKTICSWVMFDDNKMDLVKYAYSYTSDKSNYASLKEVFTLKDAQNNFSKYLQSQK